MEVPDNFFDGTEIILSTSAERVHGESLWDYFKLTEQRNPEGKFLGTRVGDAYKWTTF